MKKWGIILKPSLHDILLLIGSLGACIQAIRSWWALGSGRTADQILRSADAPLKMLNWWVPMIFTLLLLALWCESRKKNVSVFRYFLSLLFLCIFTTINYIWLSHRVFLVSQESTSMAGGFEIGPILGGAVMGMALCLTFAVYWFHREKQKTIEGKTLNS